MRYDLDNLRLNASGKRLDANLIDSVVDTGWERTIEGASTITFVLDDPDGSLVESALLTTWAWGKGELGEEDWIASGRRIDVRLGDEVYRLVKVAAQGTQVTLTLEDRDVARLRERYGARKMDRKKVTRAEFGRLLISEVKRPKIEVHVPELHVKQPIAKPKPSKQADQDRLDNGDQGIDPGTDGLTVKGEKATRQQIRNVEAILDEVQNYPSAPQRAVVALLCAITHESVMGTHGMKVSTDGDSIGWLQARTSYVSRDDALDLAYNVRRFFKEPWTGTPAGGAIEQARAGRSIADITTSIQGNATGDVYTQWKDEALKWIDAYEGGGGRIDGERTVRRPYQYERKKKENTWDCLGRLFGEVNWRRFMRSGRVWLISENRLFKQKPAMRLRVGKNGVDAIDFDLDMGARDQLQTITVTGRAGLNTLQPGQIAVVERRGPANGRWLVASANGKFGDDAVQMTLRKPLAKKPEPPDPTKTVDGDDGVEADGPQGAVEKVYLEAKAISEQNRPYVWGGGHATAGKPDGGTGRDSGVGYDCSGYTAACLLAGGFLPDSWKSGVPGSSEFEHLGESGQGQYMTIWANAEHVWIEFHLEGRKGARADTSSQGDGGSGPHLRNSRRSTAGFVARHFPGT